MNTLVSKYCLEKFKFPERIFKKYDFDNVRPHTVIDKQKEYYDHDCLRISCDSANYELKNEVFNSDVRIDVARSAHITITGCIFNASLIINPSMEDSIDLEIYIYKSIVKENMNINRIADYEKIGIDKCIINDVNITDSIVDEIDIYLSEIINTSFDGTKVNHLRIHNCFLKVLMRNESASFNDVSIDLNSFNGYHKAVRHMISKHFVYEKGIEEAFQMIKTSRKLLQSKEIPEGIDSEIYMDGIKKDILISKNIIKELGESSVRYYQLFIKLLIKSRHDSMNNSIKAELLYNYYESKTYNPLVYATLWLLGYFYKPSRIILSSVYTVLLFGIFFYIIDNYHYNIVPLGDMLSVSVLKQFGYDIVNSVYISGITFLTIGTPDVAIEIDPSMLITQKILILADAGLGLIFSSSLIISLSNKYIEKV